MVSVLIDESINLSAYFDEFLKYKKLLNFSDLTKFCFAAATLSLSICHATKRDMNSE